MTKILFLYPAVKNIPNGGLKNVFDYSNMLANDGFDVTIAFASSFNSIDITFAKKLKSFLKFVYLKIAIGKSGYTWYKVDRRIKQIFVLKPSSETLPTSDVYIATAVCTAPYIDSLECNNAKYYYIQDYEKFIVSDDDFIQKTYRLPLHKIVISRWLKRLVEKEGQQCKLIPNGFDFNLYKVTIPIENKDRYTVSMLYHINPRKDIKTGIAALKKVKERIPQLKLIMFGAYDTPDFLEEWMTYYRTPSIEQHLQINNEAAIYVGCSQIEGWGLTVGEAMMCGQAVACTDNDGYKEMAVDGDNALLSPICDSDALADNITKLISDNQLRFKIAHRGVESIKSFDIQKSYKTFRNYITSSIRK